MKNELRCLAVKDAAADNIAGQQVRRELQPAKLTRYAAGERFANQRFPDARHVFQQHVFAGQQRYQAHANDVRLAQNHAAHVGFQLRDQTLQFRRCHSLLPTFETTKYMVIG